MLRSACVLGLSLLVAASAGAAEVGGRLELPSGPKSNGEQGFGSWGVLVPWASARFGTARRLEAWAELPVVMFSPTNAAADTLGGVRAGARYPVASSVGVTLELGYLKPGYMHVSPFALPTFGFRGDLSPGVAMGMWWSASSGAASLRVAPEVVVQKNSDRVIIDPTLMTGRDIAAASANVDVRGSYQASAKVELSLLTGAWLGNNLGASAGRGMTVPAILELTYSGGAGTVYGSRAGIATALPPEGVGIGQTVYAGVFVRYDFEEAAAAAAEEGPDADEEAEEPAPRKRRRASPEDEPEPSLDDEDPIFD